MDDNVKCHTVKVAMKWRAKKKNPTPTLAHTITRPQPYWEPLSYSQEKD